jgi:predicted TIM-barrel fold metal-dependent hydrolase
LIAALLLAAAPSASAQASGGGSPGMQQAVQNNTRMLNDLRAKPDSRAQTLARLKERMAQRGVADPDARLAEIGKIFDEAAAMSAADYEKNQSQLVSRIMAQARGGTKTGEAASATSSDAGGSVSFPWIDVHAHLVGGQRGMSGAVSAALKTMDEVGIRRMILMPPPQDESNVRYDCEILADSIRSHSDRFAFLGGGGSLNVMLQRARKQTAISDGQKREFEQKANAILQQGAKGFGEMTAHHLSLHGSDHIYECVAADHPFLRLLADIAARHDVPIDFHFDLVTEDIATPAWLTSPNNPKTLRANLPAFERLLDHNPKARIVWAHAGSDNIGHWTVDLSRRLLQKHPNLYMSLRLGPGESRQNFPLTPDGQIRAEWLSLFQEFPSRFVIGTDSFLADSSRQGDASSLSSTAARLTARTPMSRKNAPVFLKALPADLARKIASENAAAIYRLKN